MKLNLHVMAVSCFLAGGMISFGQTNGPVGELADSYNAFGLKLLAQTRPTVPGKNVFLSPPGLAFVLSMAADGARGETLQEMKSTLKLTAGQDLKQANQALLTKLLTLDPKIKLEIANSIWTAEDADIKPVFLADARQFYRAESASVDFSNPATANKINNWVSEHTHGKIPKMVDPPLMANRMILLDATYFKGDWVTPFDKTLTRNMPFTTAGGQTITHPRMSRAGEFQYYENDVFQAVRLPYEGREVSLYVFLPRKNLGEFLPGLTLENWRRWLAQFQSRKGTLELPRFKLENEYKLNEILAAMGMPRAFTQKADFSGMADEPLHIGWVKQKTYVDVNEEGTVAAAVSGIGMRALVMRRERPPFQMIVDRPFFLAIRENQSGAILFLGAIVDPR